MSKAIVLSETDKDLSSAESYGNLWFIFDRPPSPFRVDDLVSGVLQRLSEIDYDPEEDFIVLTGPPDRLATLMGTICSHYDGPFKILIFDATTHKYSLRIFRPLVVETETEY